MIEISRKAFEEFEKILVDQPGLLFHIPEFRMLLANSRLMQKQEVNEFEDKSAFVLDHAVHHNMLGLANSQALWRPDLIYRPLTCIEYVRLNAQRLKLLIIGPRSEAELFSAYAVGFRPDNITAIDILSYSDLVDLGDMHALPYKDNTFDIVVAGWVLAYSSDNKRVADEIARVAKPGAYVAIGCVAEPHPLPYVAGLSCGGIPDTSDDPERPGMTKTVSRYYHVEQIYNLFKTHDGYNGSLIASKIFEETPSPELKDQRANLITIFRLR